MNIWPKWFRSLSLSRSRSLLSRRLGLERLEERLPPAFDTLATALPLSFAANSVAQASGRLATQNQVDLYAVTLHQGDQFTAAINAQQQGSILESILRLFDSSGAALPATTGSNGRDPQLTLSIPVSGTYYIGVSSSGDGAYDPTISGSGSNGTTFGQYTLSVTDLLARLVNAPSLSSGTQVLKGTLTDGQPQGYPIAVTSATYLLATVVPQSSPEFEPRLILYDGMGQLLIQSDQQKRGLASATLEQHLQVGTYYLEVSAARDPQTDNHLAYQLTTVLTDSLPPFAALSMYPSPLDFAVADLNGDGHPDIAACSGFNMVTVLLGNGDGTFQSPQSFTVGYSPDSLAVADLNGDGHPDIVAANDYDYTVSVLLGNGDGTFQPAQTYAVGKDPESLAVADLNGDGHLDIVTACYGYNYNKVSVLLGNGDGTFQAAQSFTVGKAPDAVAVADLNGDGRPDIVTANRKDNTVSVLLGNGDDTFQPARSLAVGIKPYAVTVANLGNGYPDIVVANSNAQGDNTVTLLLGNGDGTFQPARSFLVSPYTPPPTFNEGIGFRNFSDSLAVTDLGNGQPDIVTANFIPGTVSVQLGNGDGTFQPAQSFPVGGQPISLAVADVNGDGQPDCITVNYYGISPASYLSNTVNVLLGNGDGTFQSGLSFPVGKQPEAVAVADLGNGRPDIVTANFSGNTASVLLGHGDGTFQPAQDLPVGKGPDGVAVADLNGDGRPDIVTANYSDNTVSVLLGDGDGTFQPAWPFAVNKRPNSVTIADLGNGRPDIVTANADGTVSVLLGNGDGTFQPVRSFAAAKRAGSVSVAVAIADLGNGHPDIVTANDYRFDGTVSVLLGNGDGTFQPTQAYDAGGLAPSVAVADLGNGHPDIIVPNGDYNERKYNAVELGDRTVSVLLGNGDGTFQPAVAFATANIPSSMVVANLGNGHPDIVTADFVGNTVAVLLGNGDGTFQQQSARSYPVGYGSGALAVADLGNGHPDIVTANQFAGTVSVLLNQGKNQFQSVVPSDSPSHDVPQLQDLTRDGLAGAVSLDQQTGQILFRPGTGDPNNPYAPFVVVNPGSPAVDFTLVQTPEQPEIAALDARNQQVLLYAWFRSFRQFQEIGAFATGPAPARIASASLTGNGLGDLVVANAQDNTLTIAWQQSSGHFSTITRYVGGDPSSIRFADLNEDGLLDIVVSDQVSGDVSLLFNDVSHSFTTQERYRAGQGPFDVSLGPNGATLLSQLQTVDAVAADFTGDGTTGLVTLNAQAGSFSLLRAAGGGSLIDPQPAESYLVGPGAIQLLAGDFLHNGRQDLAVLTTQQVVGQPTQPGSSQIRVFPNNGDGTFGAPLISSAGEGATGFSFIPGTAGQSDRFLVGNAYGDFLTLLGDGRGRFTVDRGNLNGKPLAVGTTTAGKTFVVVADQRQDQVQVYFQDSAGSASGSNLFVLAATLPSSAALLAPGAVQLVDLNRNGNGNSTLDLVVASRLGNDILVYPGLPGGRFGVPQDFPVGFEPNAIAVGDFTGTGVPDLAVANQGSNDVSILLGQVDGNGNWVGFTHGERLSAGGSEPLAVQAGYFTGHPGILDLRVTNAGGQIVTLPGIGSNGQGSGFFRDNALQAASLGQFIVQAAIDLSNGNEFVILPGSLLGSLNGTRFDLLASGAMVVDASNGKLAVGLENGVEVMDEAGGPPLFPEEDFTDQPSALQVMLTAEGVEVVVTRPGSDVPLLLTGFTAAALPVPIVAELPRAAPVAEATSLPGNNLVLAATLLAGQLVNRSQAAGSFGTPGPEVFGLFLPPVGRGTTSTNPGNAARGGNDGPEEPGIPVPPAESRDVPGWQAYRSGADQALQERLGRQQAVEALEDAMDFFKGIINQVRESWKAPRGSPGNQERNRTAVPANLNPAPPQEPEKLPLNGNGKSDDLGIDPPLGPGMATASPEGLEFFGCLVGMRLVSFSLGWLVADRRDPREREGDSGGEAIKAD